MPDSHSSWSTTAADYFETKKEFRDSSGNIEKSFSHSTGTPGLLSGPQFTDSGSDLYTAQAALKEREAQLDQREAELAKREEAFVKQQDALDAAHEQLIGAGGDDDDEDGAAAEAEEKSSILVDELRRENEKLRTELAAAQKRSGRFLSQRAREDDAAGSDRFRLSERKSKPGGGLPMGFDPKLMEKWSAGHKMMTPRKPRPKSDRPDGK